MNLSLAFPEPPESLLPRRATGIDSLVAQFGEMHANPESPVRAVRTIPAREAEFAAFPAALDERVTQALTTRGIEALYTHQADAVEALSAGGNVVVVTPTASGKTLCYNLPVLDAITRDPGTRALYLFPTKALAEDQLHELQQFVDALGSDIRAFTFDGDTPQDARKAVRQRAQIVLTNPDMLHSGILPHHTKWAKLFENLRYIVIDELHYYRGVFGSHLANVLRRLRRICEFYGVRPQFICSSATIANPRELAERLCESPFALIDRNGAPAGPKHVVFYNPPVVNRELGIRRSYIHESRRVAIDLIDRGLQTIVFANNRLATEVLVTYLKDAFDRRPVGPAAIRGYRGGYLPRERREIERGLREGEIRGVVSTSALELGIDIGSLDAVVMAGYAGTVAATWQRSGRAGRRRNDSLVVLVASSDPLDQYIVEHPDYFFGRPAEHAQINPDNLEILLNHLKCAAFELPFSEKENFGPHAAAPLCGFLEERGFLHRSGGAWHWTSESYPADTVSLRAVTSDNFVVVDITGEAKVIAEVAFPAALTSLHEKAIYLHEAKQFQVEKFDYPQRKAFVRRVDCDYFTDAIDYTQVSILSEHDSSAAGEAFSRHGEVRVNTQVVGFKKIKFYTLENVGAGKLAMPEQEMHTTSFWLRFPPPFFAQFPEMQATERQSGLSGAGNALRTAAALLLMCDPRDLGLAVNGDPAAPETWEPDLFLYDAYPGGVGQSAPLFRHRAEVFRHAIELIESCPCDDGCPSCSGPPAETGSRAKHAALRILRAAAVSAPVPGRG